MLPFTRRLSLALPILFYVLALVSLWMHLSTGDEPMLMVAVAAGVLGVGIGLALVLHHRAAIDRLCRLSSGV